MADLLTDEELPPDFAYPPEFLRIVERGLTNLEPWWIIDGELLRNLMRGLASAYPSRRLVLFAKREDCDDMACWDLVVGDVAVVHAGATAGSMEDDPSVDLRRVSGGAVCFA